MDLIGGLGRVCPSRDAQKVVGSFGALVRSFVCSSLGCCCCFCFCCFCFCSPSPGNAEQIRIQDKRKGEEKKTEDGTRLWLSRVCLGECVRCNHLTPTPLSLSLCVCLSLSVSLSASLFCLCSSSLRIQRQHQTASHHLTHTTFQTDLETLDSVCVRLCVCSLLLPVSRGRSNPIQEAKTTLSDDWKRLTNPSQKSHQAIRIKEKRRERHPTSDDDRCFEFLLRRQQTAHISATRDCVLQSHP